MTLAIPTMLPSFLIYGTLRLPYLWFPVIGVSITTVAYGLINGAIYGAVAWFVPGFKILEKIRLRKKQENKLEKPTLDHRLIGSKVMMIASVLVIVTIMIALAASLPQPIDVAKIRSYADPMTEVVLVGFNTNNYVVTSVNFDQNMKATMSETVFQQTRSNLLSKVGYYTTKVFWKEGFEGSYLAA